MTTLLLLLPIPTIIALIAYFAFQARITWKEFFIQLAGQSLLVAGMVGIMSCSNVTDSYIANGEVTGKFYKDVSCGHSYRCNCISIPQYDSKGNFTGMQESCQTCYEHAYDRDWIVQSTVGPFHIDPVDRQGLRRPPRWEAVQNGEHASVRKYYDNYIKFAPQSLFRYEGFVENYKGKLPKYPGIFDYYRTLTFIQVGTQEDQWKWDWELDQVNKAIGKAKNANLVVILTKDLPRDYFYAIQQYWMGGKQNDVLVVIGTDGQKVLWSEVQAWSQTKDVNVGIQHALLEQKLDPVTLVPRMGKVILDTYQMTPASEFEYLKAFATPSTFQWCFLIVFSILLSIGLSVFFHQNDIFGEEWHTRQRRFYR